MTAIAFSLRVQRPDGTPAAGVEVRITGAAAPFSVQPGGVVTDAAVMLTTNAQGLVTANLVPGPVSVRVASYRTLSLVHEGGGTPAALATVEVSGRIQDLTGVPSAAPVLIYPGDVRLVGRVVVVPTVASVTPAAGVVAVALVPGRYVVRATGRQAEIDVPGDWLVGDDPVEPTEEWLLSGGTWDDTGEWDDTAQWSDAA